jgi:hypothetical protein
MSGGRRPSSVAQWVRLKPFNRARKRVYVSGLFGARPPDLVIVPGAGGGEEPEKGGEMGKAREIKKPSGKLGILTPGHKALAANRGRP